MRDGAVRVRRDRPTAAAWALALMLTLAPEAGMLSRVLSVLSECGGNILTITQSPPVHQRAGIMLTLDLEQSRL